MSGFIALAVTAALFCLWVRPLRRRGAWKAPLVAVGGLVGLDVLAEIVRHPSALASRGGMFWAAVGLTVVAAALWRRERRDRQERQVKVGGWAEAAATHLRVPVNTIRVLYIEKTRRGEVVGFVLGYPPHARDDEASVDRLQHTLAGRTGWARVEVVADPQARTLTARQGLADDTDTARFRRIAALCFNVEPGRLSVEVRHVAGAERRLIQVRYPATSADTDAGWRDRWLHAFCAKTGEAWQADWHVHDHQLVLRPALLLPAQVGFPTDQTRVLRDRIPYGVTADGTVAAWQFMHSSPHALIAGRSGRGKSVLLVTLAVAATRAGMPVVVCDAKLSPTLRQVDGHQGVWYVDELPDIIAVLGAVEALGVDRARQLKTGQTTMASLRPLVLVIDEYTLLVKHLRRRHRQAQGRGEAPTVDLLTDLMLSLREFGIHLCLATQRPDVKWVDGAMREQCGFRVLLGPSSNEFATMMGFAGLDSDSVGRGVDSDGQTVQVWQTDPAQVGSSAPDPRQLLAPFLGDPLVTAGHDQPVTGDDDQPVTSRDQAVTTVTSNRDQPVTTPMTTPTGRRVSDQTKTRMRQLRTEGLSYTDIAKEVGLSRSTVIKHLKDA